MRSWLLLFMVNIDFSSYKTELEDYAVAREVLIFNSRNVLRDSKVLIYTIHRNDVDKAKELYEQLLVDKQKLDFVVSKNEKLSHEGSYSESIQEYVEAIVLYHLIFEKKLIEKPEDVSTNDYLLGICDVSGELSRHVVHLAMDRKIDDIKFFYDVIDSIHGEFMKFNLKNGLLRKKYDSIKYALKKVEEIMYDLSLKE